MKSITDAKLNKTSYEYDIQGRLSKVTYPDLTTIENTYTTETVTEGVVKKVITKQRDGTLVTDVYNLNGLVDNRVVAHGGVTSGTTFENYVYDALNRLKSMADDDSTVTFTYDVLNRVSEENQSGKLVKYGYNKLNNLTSITYPDNRIIARTFDAVSRITAIKEGAGTIASYGYAGKGFRYLSKQFGNGDAISYLYDQGKRNTGIEALNAANTTINKYVYDYNKIHLKTFEKKEHEGNIYDLYSYDALSRLNEVTFKADDPVSPTTFNNKKSVTFDKVDNILNFVETNSSGEELQNFNGEVNNLNQYTTFDQWGLSHDQNGNTTQKGTQTYTYDYKNRLISTSVGSNTANFKYDVLGRRIEKAIGANLTKYYYVNNQVIEERDSLDVVQKQFIYGNGIDEVLRMDRDESGTMTPYYYHTNGIGSVTAITDNNGNLVERIDYDIYGMPTITDHKTDPANPVVVSNSLVDNEILYQGRRYDTESNLYYYRARYYDPIMGRFLSTDPMGYKDSMNLYQAFNMNGYNFVDPWGKQYQMSVYPDGAENEPSMGVAEFWQVLKDSGYSNEKVFDLIANNTYYSSYIEDGSLIDRIKTNRTDFVDKIDYSGLSKWKAGERNKILIGTGSLVLAIGSFGYSYLALTAATASETILGLTISTAKLARFFRWAKVGYDISQPLLEKGNDSDKKLVKNLGGTLTGEQLSSFLYLIQKEQVWKYVPIVSTAIDLLWTIEVFSESLGEKNTKDKE